MTNKDKIVSFTLVIWCLPALLFFGCGKKEKKYKWKRYIRKTPPAVEEKSKPASESETKAKQKTVQIGKENTTSAPKANPFGKLPSKQTAVKGNKKEKVKQVEQKEKKEADFDAIIQSLDKEEWEKKFAKIKEEEEKEKTFSAKKKKAKKNEKILIVKLKAKKTRRLYGPFEIVNGNSIKLGDEIFTIVKAVTNKFGEQPHACLKTQKGKIIGPFVFIEDNILEIGKARFLVLYTEYCLPKAVPEEKLLYSFENGIEEWSIPKWAQKDKFYVKENIRVSEKYAKEGKASLEIHGIFPGKRATSVIAEVMRPFNWTEYDKIACDLFIPKSAPIGIKAQIILTVGSNWKWVEMNKYVALVPGKWVTLSARLKPGTSDWKDTAVDDAFRKDVRKIAVRATSPVAYKGAIYIDNVRIIKTPEP